MASTSTIQVSKKDIVSILKGLPENVLADIFWKSFVVEDNSPLTISERKSIAKAKEEYKKGEAVKWRDIK